MSNERKNLTTSHGAPVGDNQNSMSAGSRGPTLIQDVHLLEKLPTLIGNEYLKGSFTQKVRAHTDTLK